MKKLLEFECKKCGKRFEELVENEREQLRCPGCGSLEVVCVPSQLTTPAHGKHGSWRVA